MSKRNIAVRVTAILLALLSVFTIFASVANAANIKEIIMGDRNYLSYKYNAEQDYFYTDKDHAWQHNFGYSAIYDLAAPFLDMEYDYVRVHFTYDSKDWMVQLWKGQYGELLFGCETGVYTKTHSDKEDTFATFYKCAEEDDRLWIQNTLKHDKNTKIVTVFETPYEQTWWSTGFKEGHLKNVEPADELIQEGKITFDTVEMADAFLEGLRECGFTEVPSASEITYDTYAQDGATVQFSWKNISEAENTMPIKRAGIVFAVLANIGAIFAMFTFMWGLMMFI